MDSLQLPESPQTHFDTPHRASLGEVAELAGRVQANAAIKDILGGLPHPTFLLNEHRQIVVTNPAGAKLVEELGGGQIADGLRIGEALACANHAGAPNGCGTSTQCRYCAVGQTNRSFSVRPVEYDAEFRLRSLSDDGESAQTFRIHLAPLSVTAEPLRLCTLTDITAAKSRETLEQIFFHDVLNTAQAIFGAAVLMQQPSDPETITQLSRIMSASSSKIVAEIKAQRDLLDAQDGRLEVALRPESVSRVVADVADLYRRNSAMDRRAIDVQLASGDDIVPTSATMLSRCVANLLKNALEASTVGDRVTLSVLNAPDAVSVSIHNVAVMPNDVQAQVFQRFFSTKAREGRGLGTYSVRLIVDGYLGGTVSFESRVGDGTTFVIRLPRQARTTPGT